MPRRILVLVPVRRFDPFITAQSTPFSACKFPYGTTRLELVTSGRSVAISSTLVGQGSAALAGAVASTARTNAHRSAEPKGFASEYFDMPGPFLARSRWNEPRPG